MAVVSGMSRASRIGVIIRDGTALENLGHATTGIMDKTGTLTAGRPTVVDVIAAPVVDAEEVLRLAASLDQASPHILAEAIVAHARRQQLTLTPPRDASEQPGRGMTGIVDGKRVEVGKLALPESRPRWTDAVLNRAMLDAAAIAWVSFEGELRGAVLLRDPLRRDAPRTLRRLRKAGLRRLVMLTGDRTEPARVLGLDWVHAEQTPAEKVARVRDESETATTIMVGDGVNDAPALAAATVGIAMGARGATASSEAADVVLTSDRLDRVADAMDAPRQPNPGRPAARPARRGENGLQPFPQSDQRISEQHSQIPSTRKNSGKPHLIRNEVAGLQGRSALSARRPWLAAWSALWHDHRGRREA
ncbi:HAD-IC family P-type ATPase [Saccharopolyspora sp. NPDC050389]|uniref:HAD-IC family P-type ATPase n=1 Tax=Saccharopolyspora sp. NPDC050389 TaxID=3155516 RepID=UPI0033D8A9C9